MFLSGSLYLANNDLDILQRISLLNSFSFDQIGDLIVVATKWREGYRTYNLIGFNKKDFAAGTYQEHEDRYKNLNDSYRCDLNPSPELLSEVGGDSLYCNYVKGFWANQRPHVRTFWSGADLLLRSPIFDLRFGKSSIREGSLERFLKKGYIINKDDLILGT